MQFVGYKQEYCTEVVSCLKRNFKSLSEKSDDYVREWIKPMTEYKWIEDIPERLFPYKHGMVLIDDSNHVVGFCGLIYSYIYVDGKKLIYVNPTTWAIDDKYRIYVLKVTKEVLKTADVITDFSAIESMEEMNRKTFKYDYLDKKIYKYLPIPKIDNNLKKHSIENAGQIEDVIVRTQFMDHEKYGVRCSVFQSGENCCYVFYRMIRQKIKSVKNIPYLQVLEVSDRIFFSCNLKEIVWYLQRTNLAFLEVDSRFVYDELSNYYPHKVSTTNRQIKVPEGMKIILSNLYSELAINKQIRKEEDIWQN